MNAASLPLCKELYELSGWNNEVDFVWLDGEFKPYVYMPDYSDCPDPMICPAYPLGYLLRKLPVKVKDEYQGDVFGVHLKQTGGSGWIIYYGTPGTSTEMYFNSADTPEDCAAKLAIELFKQGVLS